MTQDSEMQRNIKLHTIWLECIVKRVVGEILNQGYVVVGEVDAITAEARARENFEMAIGAQPGSLKFDGGN